MQQYFFLMRLIWYIWPKLQQMFRKAWRRAHSDLIFCMMKIYTVSRKKAQNSDVEWGRLHGQIGVLRLQIVFFQISVHQLLGWNICNIWQRSTRPFSSFSGFNYVYKKVVQCYEFLFHKIQTWNLQLFISSLTNVSEIFGHG